jgi:hypothetical protein
VIAEHNTDLVYGGGFSCHCGEVKLHQEVTTMSTDIGVHHRILERCYMRDQLGILYRRRNLFASEA